MSSTDESNATDTTYKPITRLIPFGIYLVLLLPSVACYTFIFIQYASQKELRRKIYSHNLLLIIICSFIQVSSELPIVLSYLYNYTASSQTKSFCQFWSWLDYSLNVIILLLMAHTAIERYLLVFHQNFVNQHLILLHYGPAASCIVYPIILYAYLVFSYPCINQFDFSLMTCGGPCYLYQPTVSTFDLIADLLFPVFTSSLASLVLLVRVIRQKSRMNQREIWRKNRFLLIQLLYIVILYNLLWVPMVICSLIMLFSTVPQPIILLLSINILPYGIYVVVLLCPIVSLVSLPELRKNLNLAIQQRHVTVLHNQEFQNHKVIRIPTEKRVTNAAEQN